MELVVSNEEVIKIVEEYLKKTHKQDYKFNHWGDYLNPSGMVFNKLYSPNRTEE